MNDVETRLGKPSVLINNATYSTQTDIEPLSESELDKHYLVNMKATTMLTVEFIKRFQGMKNGKIINLTSGHTSSEAPITAINENINRFSTNVASLSAVIGTF